MAPDELRKLYALRRLLVGTSLFCFEKGGVFYLYRLILDGRNQKVLSSRNIDTFVRTTQKSIGGS